MVVQAETGGGFGGKEEYPSIIALHAALLALKAGSPVRMIYDRHEDIARDHQAPSGDRPPPDRRDARRRGWWPRTSRWSWTAARTAPSRRWCCRAASLHAGGPYRCPNVRIRGRAMATNTPPNGAFRGFGAPQTEFAAEMQVEPRRRGARDRPARAAPPLGLPRWATRRRPARSCARAWPAEEVLEGAAEAATSSARRRADRARSRDGGADRDGAHRLASRASGWRWPGTARASPARARCRIARRSPRSS